MRVCFLEIRCTRFVGYVFSKDYEKHIYSDSTRYDRKVNSVKTGNDIIRFSASSNPVMFGTVEFVSKRCFKKYRGLWDYLYSFRNISHFLNRKLPFYHLELS